MRLYSGDSTRFVRDTTRNRIADMLREAYFDYYRRSPSPREVQSWRNSLRAVSQVFQEADLNDHGVLLEYELPLTNRRLDCMVTGKAKDEKDGAVIIELKQWEKCGEADGENEVLTCVGGAESEKLHPSAQVGQYCRFLEDGHSAFYTAPDPIRLSACAYLHNYTLADDDVLIAPKFAALLEEFPLFSGEGFDSLCNYLTERIGRGRGMDVLRRVEEGAYRPSKKLMEHVAGMIHGEATFVLLDEQLVVYDAVMALARNGLGTGRKTVLVIKGGPGTGKSVIALNLMADLLGEGYNVHHATGSRAFTETLKRIIGNRGSAQFKYFNNFIDVERNAVDVLICDEAHRIRQNSATRYMKKENRPEQPQVEELIRASRLAVFFIDDDQVVRPGEIGSVGHIRRHGEGLKANILEYKLEAQFRCAGSDGFINWIDNTLGIRPTANVLWSGAENFDFQIFPSPDALEEAILARVEEGYSGRLTAGFCWPWSTKLNPDRTLKPDVEIGSYRRPWNARPETTRLPREIPKANLWAHDPNGIHQIGCVYTAQGFEFDYVGVIFGNDLIYDFDNQQWVGLKENSRDPVVKRSGEQFAALVKNTYRVLLSRGLKGCYVHFIDHDTERFIKSRLEQHPLHRELRVAEPGGSF